MGSTMKTHLFVSGGVLTFTLIVTGIGYASPDYLHLVRHRDSEGNLLARPTPHTPETSVIKKTVAPAQSKSLEQHTIESQGSTSWGASIEDVKMSETVPPTWEVQSPILESYEHRVGYRTQIESIEAALTYTFYDNQLGQATYVFEPNHEDAVNYVQSFRAVKRWIMQKYGQPTSSQEIWLDHLYAYDESLWGQAVLRGHLVMTAEWKLPETDIVLVLDGGDDTIGLVAEFSSTRVAIPVSITEPMVEEDFMGSPAISEPGRSSQESSVQSEVTSEQDDPSEMINTQEQAMPQEEPIVEMEEVSSVDLETIHDQSPMPTKTSTDEIPAIQESPSPKAGDEVSRVETISAETPEAVHVEESSMVEEPLAQEKGEIKEGARLEADPEDPLSL